MRKLNKEYFSWGKQIIETSFAIYAYQRDVNISAAELSKKTQKSSSYVQEAIYNQYNLERFVKKSKDQVGSAHPDIVSKLVALIYYHCGYEKAHDFLLPYFGTIKQYMDYKSLVQEYAQAHRVEPIYSVVKESGPDHKRMVTCRLHIGDKVAEAEAQGKNNAKKLAAKVFCDKYHIDKKNETKSPLGKGYRKSNFQLTDKRMKELFDAARLMEIDNKYINMVDLEKAFTHKSFSNENKHCMYNNEALSIIGSGILGVVFGKYYYTEYNPNEDMVLHVEKANMVDEKMLVKTVPEAITKYINVSRGMKTTNDEKANKRIRVDVLKSVVAVLWINCYRAGEVKSIDYLNSYIYRIFKKESDFRYLNNSN